MLDALVGLLGVAAQAKAQSDTNNLNWASLFETKRTNRKNEKLATSSREDALGNVIRYDPGVGWVIDTTPTTKAILDAEQGENLSSLTIDAPRQRQAAERRNKRAIAADDEFEEVFNNYRYRPEKSEAGFIADAQDLVLSSRRKGLDEAGAVLSRQLLRGGRGSELASVFKAGDDLYAKTLEEALLTGKERGRQSFLQDKGAREGLAQQELSFLSGLAGDGDSMPIRFGNANQELSGDRDEALQLLLQTISANEGRRLQSTATLADSLSKSPDFGPLASALGKLTSGMGKGGGSTRKMPSAAGLVPGVGTAMNRTRTYNGF